MRQAPKAATWSFPGICPTCTNATVPVDLNIPIARHDELQKGRYSRVTLATGCPVALYLLDLTSH
jgi:hypothetical protein